MTATPVFYHRPSLELAPITSLPGDESEFLARYRNTNQNPCDFDLPCSGNSDFHDPSLPLASSSSSSPAIAMSKSPSSVSRSAEPTVTMSDLGLVDRITKIDASLSLVDSITQKIDASLSLTGSLTSSTSDSSNSNSNSSGSLSGNYLANAIESARTSLQEFGYNVVEEKGSIEAPFNKRPYVVRAEEPIPVSPASDPGIVLEPYVQAREPLQQQQQQQQHHQHQHRYQPLKSQMGKKPKPSSPAQRIGIKPRQQNRNHTFKPVGKKKKHSPKSPRRRKEPETAPHQRGTPKVTKACVPFEKTIPPTSCLRDELAKDPAYQHALKAGTLWQSLVGQHVKLPPLWFDGVEPARPYLGCEDSLKRNKWSYFGRHRVAGDPKLNALVKHGNSSGKLLLHIVCRHSLTLAPMEDIVVGVFHPNAELRDGTTPSLVVRHEDCRDVWIGHRSRSVPHRGRRIATRIESLLRYLHRNKVDKTPLGSSTNSNNSTHGADSKRNIDNTNMALVFGSRPPRHTVFVVEEELYELLQPPSPQARNPASPASVILLRTFLR